MGAEGLIATQPQPEREPRLPFFSSRQAGACASKTRKARHTGLMLAIPEGVPMLNIACAQFDYTVGDIEGNAAMIEAAARRASEARSDIVVFSELSLTGYYPGDLLESDEFIDRVAAQLEALRRASRATPGLAWVVGAPLRRQGPGKPLGNSLVVLLDGEIVLRYAKQLLPTYNIFDEHRHFEPGPDVARVLRLRGHQIGFMICEDGWNLAGRDYPIDPFARLADAAPDLVVSINASPSNVGKQAARHALFAEAARRYRLPILYVNQIGGQDQLVFDGASFAVGPEQGVCFEAGSFAEEIAFLAFDPVRGVFADAQGAALPPLEPGIRSPLEFYGRQIVLGLRDYARRTGFASAVVGCSGGIDSALTLDLAVEALGADRVVAVGMPSQFSSAGSIDDSSALCRNLGIRFVVHPIGDIVAAFQAAYLKASGTPLSGVPLENLQARVRGTILMEYSNAEGHLLLTTGNKSEISVGYCTLYGDTNGGLGLIGDLYKTEIFALARYRNEAAGYDRIPRAIFAKAPSAELSPGQKDSDTLPPYEVLDDILKLLVEGRLLPPDEHAAAAARVGALRRTPQGQALVDKVKRMLARNEYKRRQAPMSIRVRARAFGSGRRMPIAAKLT